MCKKIKKSLTFRQRFFHKIFYQIIFEFLPLIWLLCPLEFFPISKSIKAGHFDKVPLLRHVLRTISLTFFPHDSSTLPDNLSNTLPIYLFQSAIYTIPALFLSNIPRASVPKLRKIFLPKSYLPCDCTSCKISLP